MMEHASCAACGADDVALLFTTPDTRHPASAERFPVPEERVHLTFPRNTSSAGSSGS